MKLPEIGVKRPIMTAMIFISLIIIGLFSLFMLPIDLFPEIEMPSVTVIAEWPGASTEDVETKVTRVIEKQLSIINNLDEMISTTTEGSTNITCTFLWGTDLADAASDVRDRIEFAKRDLPDEVENPIVYKFNSSQMPIISFGISAKESWEKLATLIDNEVAIPLQRVSGVGAVQLRGGLMRQINILLNRERLAAYGLTLTEIESKLAAENITLPAGHLKIGTIEFTIRVPGEYQTAEEIKHIPLLEKEGVLVRVSDVADVYDGFEEETQMVENMGNRGMMMMVQKRSGANTVAVTRAVLDEIEEIKTRLPQDIHIFLMTDTSDFIKVSINNVTDSVMWGGLFVILVAFLFLRSLRMSLVIAATIPCSLIISFIFIYLFNWTINLISLASLAIAIGMVVDNAVVILENISTYIQRGARVREASMFGASEVGLSIVASTLTTIVVFVPLMFLKGIEGIMFTQLAGIITITLLGSLVSSLMLTPMMASKLIKAQDITGEHLKGCWRFMHQQSEHVFEFVERMYDQMIRASLAFRPLPIILAVLTFAGAICLYPLVGTEFQPDQDDGELSVTIQLPVSTRVELTADLCRKTIAKMYELEKQFSPEHSLIRVVNFRCGQSSGGMGGPSQSNIGRISVRLTPSDERNFSTKAFGNELRKELVKWPDIVKTNISTGNRMMKSFVGTSGKPIVIDILGHDLELTESVAKEVLSIAQRTPGAMDPSLSLDPGNRELNVKIDREKAAVMGVSMQDAVGALRTLFYGREATRLRDGEDEYFIFMQLDLAQRSSVEDLLNTEVALPNGRMVRLDSIANVVEEVGPITIERKNQERVVRVELDSFERSMGEVVADIKQTIADEILLPAGVGIQYSGSVKEQDKSFTAFAMMVVLGVILVYMVMASQFESLLAPFIVMFSIPFGFSGVIFIMVLTNTTLSMMSFIGVILLMGTVVNNAIVLLDYTIILRQRGLSVHQAIIMASRQRLRPILITTLTTVLGMCPMAFSTAVGAEAWRPLGLTVIGGLLLSTFVTLVLIPVLYSLISRDSKPINAGVTS